MKTEIKDYFYMVMIVELPLVLVVPILVFSLLQLNQSKMTLEALI